MREQLHGEGDSPPACWALALAALADGDDEAARRASDGMLAGSEAFGRAAGAVAALARRDRQAYAGMLAAIVADFEARQEHLTGVPIADTALVLDRLAERRGHGGPPAVAAAAGGRRRARHPHRHARVGGRRLLA